MALNLDEIFSTAERYIEPTLTVGSSLLSEPVAGWSGLLTGNPENVGKVHHALTYMPRTQSGQEGLAGLGEYMSDLGSDIMATPYLGQSVRNFGRSVDQLAEYSPAGAATLQALPAAVALMAAPESRIAFRNFGSEVGKNLANPVGPVGRAAQGGAVNLSALAPMMRGGQKAVRTVDFAPAAAERAAASIGKNLERTHKATIAEKTASDISEEQRQMGRNLLAQ